jgi:LPXTG-motif cell wall-anchored protein
MGTGYDISASNSQSASAANRASIGPVTLGNVVFGSNTTGAKTNWMLIAGIAAAAVAAWYFFLRKRR